MTEVTERAELPMLTLSYSDLLTERGFKYIFQTAAPASRQSELGLPELMKLAETASGKTPEDGGDADGQHGDVGRDRQGAQGELSRRRPSTGRRGSLDAAALRRHAADPEGRVGAAGLLLFMPNAISDAKLGLEKINEFGLGQGKIPTVSFSITIAEPDMLQSVSPEVSQGIMTIVANGAQGP